MEITKIIANFSTRLNNKLGVSGTTGELQSNLDLDGEALPTGYYFFTLDGDNSLKEYIYCLKTGNALTNIYSVSSQGVKTAGVKKTHNYNCLVEITNFAQLKLLSDILKGEDTLDADNPLKYDGTPTIDDDKHIGTKATADAETMADVAATEAVYGKAKVSVAPVDADSPTFLGNNDPKVPTADENDAMAGSYGTPGSANKFCTEDNANRINNLHDTGAEGVAGIKTFSSIPVSSAGNPTTDNQIANKAYVNTMLGA